MKTVLKSVVAGLLLVALSASAEAPATHKAPFEYQINCKGLIGKGDILIKMDKPEADGLYRAYRIPVVCGKSWET